MLAGLLNLRSIQSMGGKNSKDAKNQPSNDPREQRAQPKAGGSFRPIFNLAKVPPM